MGVTPLRFEEGVLRLHVWVVPGASRGRIAGPHGDKIKVRVSSPPDAGRANEEVAELLRGALEARVKLVKGMRSRYKVFEIAGQDIASATRKLGLSR